jgi:hypothetical protein
VWVAKWCLVGNRPTSPTLTEELGGQHRPDAEQPHQRRLALHDRGPDPRLDLCDPLVQLVEIRQLPASADEAPAEPEHHHQIRRLVVNVT